MSRKSTIHIVPRDNGWASIKSGATKATKVFDLKANAVSFGKESAKNAKTELFVHNKDAKIAYRNSFGNDDFPPKG